MRRVSCNKILKDVVTHREDFYIRYYYIEKKFVVWKKLDRITGRDFVVSNEMNKTLEEEFRYCHL